MASTFVTSHDDSSSDPESIEPYLDEDGIEVFMDTDTIEPYRIRQQVMKLFGSQTECTSFMYLEDIVRLSTTSRFALTPTVREALAAMQWMVKCYDEAMRTIAFPDMHEYTKCDDIGWDHITTDSNDDDLFGHVSMIERVPVQSHIFKYILLRDDLRDFMYFEDIVHLSISSRLALAPAVSQTLACIKWMVECHDDTILNSVLRQWPIPKQPTRPTSFQKVGSVAVASITRQ